jgi:hypothetical protein
MRRGSLRHALLLALASACLPSCGSPGASTAKSASGTEHAGVLRFYPLDQGMQWSYVVREVGQSEGILSVTKVVGFDGTTAVLSQGGQTLSMRVAKDGIVREPSHAYLLKWPVILGDKWAGKDGAQLEVTKVDEKVLLEAGSFEGCVETTERFGGDEARAVRTVFCPEVGPVIVEVRSLVVVPGEVPPALVGRLQAYGPAMDLGKPGMKATPPGGK